MDWGASIDAYCERVGPAFWAEPLNALTNIAFVIAAGLVWRRTGRTRVPVQAVMILSITAIGIGSFFFHTLATPLAGLADTIPILIFILAYVFAANRDLLGWTSGAALAGAIAFLPFAATVGLVFAQVPFFQISAAYWPLPLLMAIYAMTVTDLDAARGLWIGAAMLTASTIIRSLDMPLCDALPMGTHFIWHVLNAAMLGWIVEVHRRALARRTVPG
ncbi:MAG: ceramidase domain-containing protein [Pseudomonadota bacterium]